MSYIFLHWNQKKKLKTAHTKKKRHLKFEPRTSAQRQRPTRYRTRFFLTWPEIGMYLLYVQLDCWDMLTKKRKQHPPPGDGTSTAEATPSRVGKDEQGEARRANTTRNGGPHLELGRLRLKTWYNPEFRLPRRHGQHNYTYTH